MTLVDKSVFHTRLRELIKERGITITALAKELKISRQSVSQYINGSAYPNIERLFMIARFFDVSIDYLVYGAEFSSKAKLEFSSREDRDLLKKYHELPPDLQGKLLGYMDGLLSAVQQQVPGEEKLSV